MPFEKGNTVRGSRKGKKNKRTEQWDAFADYCLNGGLQRFQDELGRLKGKDYVMAFSNMLEFHKPKQQRIEASVAVEDNRVHITRTVLTKNVGT